jgi:hypothetical protein
VLNPSRVIADIDAVFLQFPDIAEDTELKGYVLAHGTDFETLIKFCLDQMQEAGEMIEGIRIRVNTLAERCDRFRRKQEVMRALIQKVMEHAGTNKWTLPEATLSLGKRPQQVIITDEAQIPETYKRMKWEPNKAEIKHDLLRGQEIPGAVLSNGGVGLTVRCK